MRTDGESVSSTWSRRPSVGKTPEVSRGQVEASVASRPFFQDTTLLDLNLESWRVTDILEPVNWKDIELQEQTF